MTGKPCRSRRALATGSLDLLVSATETAHPRTLGIIVETYLHRVLANLLRTEFSAAAAPEQGEGVEVPS
jgi:hypothetical protein